MKKVVIVGAGPAGLFAAYELAGKYDITVIDKGEDIEQRTRDNVLEGVGGAGLFSDGKIIYHTRVGTSLFQIVSDNKVQELNNYVESIFKSYDAEVKILDPERQAELDRLKRKAMQSGMDFVVTRIAHVGTNKLIELILKFRDNLKLRGVKFLTSTNVNNITKEYVETLNSKYGYDYLIIAPGRGGSAWLESVVKNLGMEFGKDYIYNATDIGVRVEVKREITDQVTDLIRDMKFYMEAGRFRRKVRTFCTCPGGKVAIEKHEDGFCLVNGHSEEGDPYENTNFAFLATIQFTEPVASGNEFARLQAKLASNLSGGKVLVQRFGDLLAGRRSKEKNVNTWMTQPSLREAVPGSIALQMPAEYIETIIDGLQKLDKVMPGIASEHTLLYSPEMKLHGLRLLTNEFLETHVPNIYVAGDGPGLTRGIVAAAATGVLAARGILKK